jgi:hypothetical protein
MAITKIQAGALPADVITTAAIDDASITHAKLHTTMDLSSKTVTLPTLSTLNTTGSVGIGTTSPNGLLELDGKTDNTPSMYISHNGNSSVGALMGFHGGNDFRLWNYENGVIKVGTNNAERMRIDSSGNVGIGTSSIATGTKLIVKAATDQNLEVEYTSGGKLRLSALNDARSANVPLQFTSTSFEFLSGNVGIGIVPNFTPGASRRKLQIGNGTNGALIAMGTGTNESLNPRIFSNQYTLGLAAGITTGELQFYTNDVERITVEAGGTIQMGGGDAPANPPIIMGGNNFSVYMGATNTNTINVGYNENQTYNLHINYKGYQSGTTQFRNLVVNDGKTADIARFKGEYKLLELPGAPSFRARVTQGFSGNNTTIVFQSVQHNIGNHYNSTNGRFTAPVSGSYFFGYQGISGSNISSNEQNMSLVLNGTTGICDARARGYTESSFHLKTVIYLSAGDYVTVVISNANTSTYAAGFHNQFFGHFIG